MNPYLYRFWHEQVYLPIIRKLIADMMVSGALPPLPEGIDPEWRYDA